MNKWVALFLLLAFPATAAEPAGCYEIVDAPAYESSLMVNRCTGDSWILVRTAADEDGVFTYTWRALDRTQFAPALSTDASRQAAETRKRVAADNAAMAAAEADRPAALLRAKAKADERERWRAEQGRLRTALRREPTDAEVSYCVAKSEQCPSPPP